MVGIGRWFLSMVSFSILPLLSLGKRCYEPPTIYFEHQTRTGPDLFEHLTSYGPGVSLMLDATQAFRTLDNDDHPSTGAAPYCPTNPLCTS